MENNAPFSLKDELKKIEAASKKISDPKARKTFVEQESRTVKAHAEMLFKMSKFVYAKNKNKK